MQASAADPPPVATSSAAPTTTASSDANRTFRTRQTLREGTTRYDLHRFARSLVRSGDLSRAVQLPPGASRQHWLSVHTVDFYNITNVLYGSITEFCTPATCPAMISGPRYEYLWKDGVQYKKAARVSAPEYVALLMNWIEQQINDEALFPSDDANPYPADFEQTYVRNIFKRLFRVYAHMYYCHFDAIRDLQEEAHLNTAFKHFMLFVWEFDLVDTAELAPLNALILNLMGDRAAEMLGAAAAGGESSSSAAGREASGGASSVMRGGRTPPAGAAVASAPAAVAGSNGRPA